MKTRTCPYCNYKYSRIDYVQRLLLKVIWSKWDCPKCEQKITFDNKRRLIVALAFGLWTLLLIMAKTYFSMNLTLWLLFLLIFLLGAIYIFTFDNFTKSKS